MATDDELLDAWRAGDTDAGSALFERHFDRVARFFGNKVSEGLDDLVQQTFLGCVEARDRFRGEAGFSTYLLGIAANVLYKHYRKRRTRRDLSPDFGVTAVQDLDPSPSIVAARRDEQRLLLQALRRIPLDSQVVLELHYWEQMTAQQIGEVVGIPLGTAKTRLRRAKQLLQEQLQTLASTPAQLESTVGDLERWARSLRDAATPGESNRDVGGTSEP